MCNLICPFIFFELESLEKERMNFYKERVIKMLLHLKGICKSYLGETILSNISMKIERGEKKLVLLVSMERVNQPY